MKLIASVIASAALASLEYPEKGNHWDEMCADQKYGSPINLDYTYNNLVFVPNTDRKIELSAGYYNARQWNYQDNHHSIVFSPTEVPEENDSMKMSGTNTFGQEYNFHSFHFHWGNKMMKGGSEHTVNGRHHWAEVHFVHYGSHCGDLGTCISLNEDGTQKYSDGLAVLGGFIEIDHEMAESDTNDNLMMLLQKSMMINRSGENKKVMGGGENDGEFALYDLLGAFNLDNYYRYDGSLTTPNCNEAVVWSVMKSTLKVPPRIARRFLRVSNNEDATERTHDNFRAVQPMHGRKVEFVTENPDMARMLFEQEKRFDMMNKKPRHVPVAEVHDEDDHNMENNVH